MKIGNDDLIASFDTRQRAAREQCFLPSLGSRRQNPITGAHSRLCPWREQRHSEGGPDSTGNLFVDRSKCFYCEFQTPSNLAMISADGNVVVPDERDSF